MANVVSIVTQIPPLTRENHKWPQTLCGFRNSIKRMTTPWEEKQILRDIVDGLNAAIATQSWEHEELDPIKFNKLLYLAVKHFELPVTYRWYKYGSDFTPHGMGVSDVRPESLTDLPSPDVPRIASPQIEAGISPPSPRQVKDFYVEEVDDIERLFRDDTKEYLRSFYHDYAPESLEGVYTACAVLQKSLDSIGYADDPGQEVVDSLDTVLDELKTLNKEVFHCPKIADVDTRYQPYAELLKDVLITVEDMDGDLSSHQEEMLREVIRFFYEKAWKLVALKLASEESSGANALDWRETAAGRFNVHLSNYDDELQALRHQCEQSGLIADSFREYSGPLVRSADVSRKVDLESDTAEEWEGTSKEANRFL